MKIVLLACLSLSGILACGRAAPTASMNSAVGGYAPIAATDASVVAAADFAVEQINRRSNSLIPYQLVSIISARAQVVAGTNYALRIQLSRGTVLENHDVLVYTRPWQSYLELTQDSIVPPEAAVGERDPIDLKDEGLATAVAFAVEELNAENHSPDPYTLAEILSAESQVVAGLKYTARLSLKHGDALETHTVVVFSQPWAKVLELVGHSIDQ